MSKIRIDSRKVQNGDTFVALRGVSSDGHSYIPQAIQNGATKIIAEEGTYSVSTEIVKDTREYLINYLKDNYTDTLKDITFIGVTGTSGKTTSSYLIYKLLNLLGTKTAYIGTIGFYLEDKIVELPNTTPEVMDLFDMFLECQEKGVKAIVMEVSSQALDYKRVEGFLFDYAVFTNLTQDHLDYHKTMENYMQAKQKLFTKLKKNGFAILNGDDDYYKHFMIKENNNTTFGFNPLADYKIVDCTLEIDKTLFEFEVNNNKYHATINLPGKYNIYNFLTALIVVNKMGHDLNKILENTDKLSSPPGRMNSITYNNAVIIVDYAHKPDAVLNVLNGVNSYKKGKVITIIGCGGDRDRTKRPIMGDIATKLSDSVIFTNDNPRTEEPEQIMNDIVNGLKSSNYEIIFDRKNAIEKGIDMLEPNDMLLILGKGHENYQIIGKEKKHFDDREIVLQYIESKK